MDALIEALGDLRYVQAVDVLFKLRGTEYDALATRALNKIVPERLTNELLAAAKDQQLDSYLRERAMVTLCDISATNSSRQLVPLLDDLTPIVYSRPMPGPEWRICDRAALTIGLLAGLERGALARSRSLYLQVGDREATMRRVREWAKSAQ